MTGWIPGVTIHWGLVNSDNRSGSGCCKASHFWGAEDYSGIVLTCTLCLYPPPQVPADGYLSWQDTPLADPAWLSFCLCLLCVTSHPYTVTAVSWVHLRQWLRQSLKLPHFPAKLHAVSSSEHSIQPQTEFELSPYIFYLNLDLVWPLER